MRLMKTTKMPKSKLKKGLMLRQESAQSTQLNIRHAIMSCHAANVHVS